MAIIKWQNGRPYVSQFTTNFLLAPKSLYISHAVSNLYGTEIEILAGFGPAGSTQKQIWSDYEQL